MAHALTTLKVKCPHCHIFLKDKEVQLDGKDSIKLNIDNDGKKGHIWISAKYGSNTDKIDIDIPESSIPTFTCPKCSHDLANDEDCNKCGAPMASIQLSNGGMVNFCTRQGCTNNSIEFPEVTFDIDDIERDIKEKEKLNFSLARLFKTKEKISIQDLRQKMLEKRTYLHSYCPTCHKNLTDAQSLSLRIITQDDQMGFLITSPFLGDSMIKCTLNIEEGTQIKEIQCPYCETNLIKSGASCRSCGSKVAGLFVPGDSHLVEYMICTRKGCLCHGLDEDDILDIKAAYHSISDKEKR